VKKIYFGTLMEDVKTKLEPLKKTKATVYMTEEDEVILNEIFIKRLRERRKTDKSALICEGIRLLYEKEVAGASNG
jgi:hypothetical protein